MDEHPIAIAVQDLTKRYHQKQGSPESLKDISFQVPLGKICCLLGPNGSGKTTLLKILAGLLQPSSGSITIAGVKSSENPRAVRANIGWMPAEERSGFYGRLTGRQNLEFFGVLQGMSKNELDRVIGNLALQIGLQEELDQTLLQISSGAKQKIGLARALLHDPGILLLDEPVRNLDPHTILRLRRLLKDHLTLTQHKTIVLSTHLLEEARRVADIIIILKEGRIIKMIEAKDLETELRETTLEDYYLKTVDSGAQS